jgi:hypothetical protein
MILPRKTETYAIHLGPGDLYRPPPPSPGFYRHWVPVFFHGIKRLEVMLNTHLYLLPRLRMIGVTRVLPLYALKTWTRATSRFVHRHFKTKLLSLLYCAELSFAWHEEVIIFLIVCFINENRLRICMDRSRTFKQWFLTCGLCSCQAVGIACICSVARNSPRISFIFVSVKK